MTRNHPTAKRSKLSIYLQAVRPFAFSASIVPVVVGAMLALAADEARWELFPLVLVGSMLMHAGTNLVSEYYDLLKGVDRPGTYGSSRVLVEGLLPPRDVLLAGLACFAGGLACGLVLTYFRGWPVLALGMIGLAGGFFYTGSPVGYKYRALGDVLVFTLMGPLMVLGAHYVLAGRFTGTALIVSLPVGCLVAAILSGNNLRDIRHDGEANVRTLENVVGLAGAKAIYCGLVVAAHLIVVVMVLAGVVSPWAMLVFLASWPAVRNTRTILRARLDRVAEIARIDVQTAQHHLMFGLLLAAGLLLGAVL